MGVRVAGGRDGAGERLALGHHELERAVGLDADRHHRDRALLDVELHARALPGLAVVLLERAQDRLLRRDVQVVRAVVAHEHRVALEVDRVELREAAADVEAVEDHHRHAVLEVELAAHREARRREERVAHDEVRHELAREGLRLALVVVGEAVELALLDELLERHGRLRGHVEVVRGELLGPGVAHGVGRVEEAEDALLHRLHLRGVGVAVERQALVWLAERHVAAKRAADRGGIDLHVVHRLEHVAHQADARAAEVVEHVRDGAPLAHLLGGLRVAVKLADDDVRDGTPVADRDARELGHGAEVVVVELLVDRGVLVVETRVGLESHEHDRHVQLAHERREGGGCRVGHHVHEEEVEVGRLHRGDERVRLLRVVRHPEARHLHLVRGDLVGEHALLLQHVLQQPGALFPVRIQAHRDHAHVGREGLAARHARGIRQRGPNGK